MSYITGRNCQACGVALTTVEKHSGRVVCPSCGTPVQSHAVGGYEQRKVTTRWRTSLRRLRSIRSRGSTQVPRIRP
jgi:uncharacterized Zn finger protein (UPF0148 family)